MANNKIEFGQKQLAEQAGFVRPEDLKMKENFKKNFRIIDENTAVNRYVHHMLPFDLTSQDIERMVYYKAQLCAFYDDVAEEWFIMPYTDAGAGLDFYQRPNKIHPVPMCDSKSKDYNKQHLYLSNKILTPLWKIPARYANAEDMKNCAVILRDYTPQLSQTILPRSELQDCVLDNMADVCCYYNTALLMSTGVQAYRCQDADTDGIDFLSRGVKSAALTQHPFISTTGTIDFQNLSGSSQGTSQEFCQALQELETIRLSNYGLNTSGFYQKSTYVNNNQTDMNQAQGGNFGLIYQDGLSQRDNFHNLCNWLWQFGSWVEPSENLIGDMNGNGVIFDEAETQDTAMKEGELNA